jgi:hypothetical protein
MIFIVLGGCVSSPPFPFKVEPQEFPPSAKLRPLRPPEAFDSLDGILRQLDAVVQGNVAEISYTYDDCLGPRTIVNVQNVTTLLGNEHTGSLELKILSGPLPDGRWVYVSESWVCSRSELCDLPA